jgi:hypothetical protein
MGALDEGASVQFSSLSEDAVGEASRLTLWGSNLGLNCSSAPLSRPEGVCHEIACSLGRFRY